MEIQNLIKIAEDLGLKQKAKELNFFAERLAAPDKDLILPLVGEFSSGKTTLINSLLDNPNLETASKATTASIFEIHFGSNDCRADLIKESGEIQSIDNVSDIENAKLGKADIVKVFDTSSKIGSSTILVDTPGLSSNNPAHKIALSSYLPNADAILLVTDVNQQITRSILDFLKTSKIAGRPVYLMITKCDTKTPKEVENAKAYIKKTIDYDFAEIISVSSTKGNMSEFYNLISKIQKDKNKIVEKAVNERIKGVAKEMSLVISELLKQKNSTKDIENAIDNEERKLRRLNQNIDALIADSESKIEDQSKAISNEFYNLVFNQVDSLVKTHGRNCGDAISSSVNSTGIMLSQKFQKNVLNDIISMARMRQNKIEKVPMSVLENIDMSGCAFNGFSIQLDVSSVGHKLDKVLGYGILAAGAVALTIGVAASAGGKAAAAGGKAASVGGKAAAAEVANNTGKIIASDAITDAASAAYTSHRINKINKRVEKANEFTNTLGKVNGLNQNIRKSVGAERGIIETSVGFITDFFAKPQRQKAVHDYVYNTLVPEFGLHIQDSANSLLDSIAKLLKEEASNSSQEMIDNLNSLNSNLKERKDEYAKKVALYKEYAQQLNKYAR